MPLIVPYYEQGGITLYHGDCREVLSTLGPAVADLVLTDPPYNCGKAYGTHDDAMEPADYRRWLRGIFAQCRGLVTDGLVYTPGVANLLDTSDVLASTGFRPLRTLGWHKREFAGDKWNGGPAMSWEPVIWASRCETPFYRKRFGSTGRDFLVVNSTHGNYLTKLHPCPKPAPVVAWLLGLFCPDGGTVLDPFVGTGTTLRVAKDNGLRAVGIELEERYCEIAARRLDQGILDFETAS